MTIQSAGTRRSARPNRTVAAAIADICRNRPPDSTPDATTRRLFVDAARHHRVAPLAHVLLRSSDPDLAAELKADRDAAMSKHISASVALEGLGQILEGLAWVTFKGPVLSEHAHPVSGLRSYQDVDVLVSPSDLRHVTARLLDAGWQIADFSDMLHNPETPGEMHWVSPAGILVDLHWSMINMAPTRRLFSVSTDELLERRVQVPLGLSTTWTLHPVDSVVHVCLHAALTGAHRMLLILDADQLARRITDWDEVVSRAHSWGAETAVAIVMSRASGLLQTPVPDALAKDLGVSSVFRAVTRAIDHVAPVPTLHKEASLARLVARSARPGSAGTLAAVGTRGLLGVAHRLGTISRRTARTDRRPADLDALETYLQAVETQRDVSR